MYDEAGRASVYHEMLRSPSDAIALARLEEPSDWMIYSGTPEMLRSFVGHFGRTRPSRRDIVTASTVTYHGIVCLTVQASDFRPTATPSNRPGVGTYPKNINPRGVAVWDRLMQTQRVIDNLAGQPDRAAWAIAVQLYFQKASRSNITPFDEDGRASQLPQHQHEHALKAKGIQHGFLIRSFVSQLHKNLKTNNLVTNAQSGWALRDVIFANNKYNVAITKTIPLNRNQPNVADATERYLLSREGFSDYPSMPNTVVYRLSDAGYLLVFLSSSPLRAQFTTILAFSRPFLEGAFGLRRNALNKADLLQKLRTYAQEHLLADANYSL
jgi:hypothetical protein